MKIIKLLSKLVFFFVLFVILSINLSGCCGHSGGGGGGVIPVNKTTLADVTVNDDGSVSINSNGISLNALPDTFQQGTKIKITQVTGGDLLSLLGMSGKDISLSSPVFGIEITPEQEILNKAATLTIDLSDKYDSTKKQYFALNRETPTLVTSQVITNSLDIRPAKKNTLELGFVTTFSYAALACLKKEILSTDPSIWCDNPIKEVINDKYTSDVTIFSQLSTKDDIEKVFNGKSSFNISIRTDGTGLTKLSHKSSPIASRNSLRASKLNYGSIDLTKTQSTLIDSKTIRYDAFFGSNNQIFQDIPRRIVIESVFKSTDNIPISSQENVIYFRPARRPYVVTTYPLNGTTITNDAQIENIVVDFSEPMNTASVENATTIKTQGHTYTKDSSKYKLTFAWSDNNKKVNIKGANKLETATGTYNIKIAKTASSQKNANIGKDSYSLNAEDVNWSFNFKKKNFYVIMTTPKPGDTNVEVANPNETRKGPDIFLKFNKNYYPQSMNSAISLKTSDGTAIKISDAQDFDEFTITITPRNALTHNTLYIVEVSPDVKTFDGKETLGEKYTATFKTKEPFASGSGTADDPYLIKTQEELANINLEGYVNTDKYYKLANDINYVPSSNLTSLSKASWKPIGNEKTPFKGFFDGNNKSINDLKISETNSSNVGLFGYIVNSSIKNLTLKDSNINGKDTTGSLAGNSIYSTIQNIKITGLNLRVSSEKAGGLIGSGNSTTINNCSIDTEYDIDGTADYIGGLAGIITANSTITNSYVKLTNSAKIVASDLIGGLVGSSENSKINNSKFYGIIRASSKSVGGIVGFSDNSKIISCSALDGSASGSQDVGGICGLLTSNSSVEKCNSSLNISGSADNVGGLIGKSQNSDISNSYVANISVEGTAANNGGLIGHLDNSSVEYCYSQANVSGMDSVGGLVGLSQNNSSIKNCAALNNTLAGSNKDLTNKILGSGKADLNNNYSLSTTQFVFTGSDPKVYTHTHTQFDGTEKKSSSEIFKNLHLDSSVWNTSGTYPVFK